MSPSAAPPAYAVPTLNFDPSHITSPTLSASLDRAVAKIASDKRGALEADVTLTGAQVSVGQRFGHGWAVGGYAGIDWNGNKSAGVRLSGAW